MGADSRISEDDIRQAARKIADERTTSPLFNLGNDHDHEDDVVDYDMDEDDLEDEITERDRRDVFADSVRPRIEKGDFVKVVIYRDGELVATKKGSEIKSWEDLHKSDIGRNGGVFKIQVKDERGVFRGQQTKNLGRYLGGDEEEGSGKKGASDLGTITSYLAEISRQNDAKFERMIDKLDSQKNAETSQQTQLLTALIGTLAQPKNDNSSEIQMNFMKMMMEMQNKSDDKMMTLFEKMNDKFEKIVDKISEKPKDDGLKWPDVMQMIESAKSGAKEETQYMYELIEKKAELIAAEKSENSGDESMTDKAIKALLPALPALIQQGRGAPAIPAPTAHLAPNPRQRRPVSRPQARPQRRPVPDQAKAMEPQASEALRRDTVQSREVSRQESVKAKPKKSHGLPSVDFDDEIEVIEPEYEEIEESVTMGEEPIEEVDFEITEDHKLVEDQMLNLCIPHVVSYLLQGGGSEDCADACIMELEKNNVSLSLVNKIFSAEKLIAIAEKEGLIAIAESQDQGEEAKEWLRNFYGSLSQKSTV